MKKLFLFTLILFSASIGFSQDNYSNIKLEESTDYKTAETKVLKAASFLLSTKFDEEDLERLYATEFVIKWMAGTPDYTFEIGEKISKAFSQNPELINLYMIAMAKSALEHQENAKDLTYISINAAKLVIEYTGKAFNNVKQTAELKKMAAALKKGELERYLGL